MRRFLYKELDKEQNEQTEIYLDAAVAELENIIFNLDNMIEVYVVTEAEAISQIEAGVYSSCS